LELQTLFIRESAAVTFSLETNNKTYSLFLDHTNGASFVPKSESGLPLKVKALAFSVSV
jgi:hypothetical protein